MNKYSEKDYKEMYERVRENITYVFKDRQSGSWKTGYHNSTNLAKMTQACLENNLVPEKNHLTMIKDKVYITWEGTKWILKQKGVYWEVLKSDFTVDEEGNSRCQVELGYLPDIYGHRDAMKTYLQFIQENVNNGVPISDIKTYLLPKSVGVGLYRSSEAGSSGRHSDMETMALKRAIFTALNYSQVIDGSIDTLEYGKTSNDVNKNEETVEQKSKPQPKKKTISKKKEEYSDLQLQTDVDLSDQEEIIINEAFGKKSKDELGNAEKKKLTVWLRNLGTISNKEEMLYVLQAQLSIYQMLTENPDLQEYFMELLKMYDLKSLFNIVTRKVAEEAEKALKKKLS